MISTILLGRILFGAGLAVVTILTFIWVLWPPGVMQDTQTFLKRGLVFISLIILVLALLALFQYLSQDWGEPRPVPTQP